MSIPAISWCIEQKGLPPGEWVVLFHLCHCHNHETGRCDPSQEYLAEATGMGARTIRRHLKTLEERGLIWRRSRGVHGGGRLSDLYILGHEPAKMAASRTGQTVHTNRPNGAKNVHEMAGKQEGTGRDDDDDAGAREPPSVDNFSEDQGPQSPTLRERILAACGADPVSGLIGPNGGTLGTQADMFEVGRWQADLGLDGAAILAVITDTMARKRDGPPRRLSYFTRPMQEEAARRAAPPLQPVQQEFENHARGSQEIYAPGERIPGDRRYGSGPGYRGGSAAHRALYEGFARFAAQVEAGGDGD